MGDEQRCDVEFLMQCAQPKAQFLAYFGVQRAEWFIEQQYLGFKRQGAGQSHALSLAAGKLGGKTFRKPFKLDEFEESSDAFTDLGLLWPLPKRAHAQSESNVLKYRQMPKQGIVLKGKAGFAFVGRQACNVTAMKQDSRIRIVGKFQAADNSEQGRFSGAGRPQEGDEFTGFNLETDVVEGRRVPLKFFEIWRISTLIM